MPLYEPGVPLDRVQIMEVGVGIEALGGGGAGKTFVGDDETPSQNTVN